MKDYGTDKSFRADLERSRPIFFQVGCII